jgi:hypothetical protein
MAGGMLVFSFLVVLAMYRLERHLGTQSRDA